MRFTALIQLLAVTVTWTGAASSAVIKGKVECRGLSDNRDAVVYLENVAGKFTPPAEPPKMDQFKMEFIPHILPILLGSTVRFLNSEPVMHNVFTPSKAGDKFNLGTWPKGQVKTYTFAQVGEVRLLCNVHPEMEAWILVLANPYFAKTGPDGSYSIRDVPAGKYTLRVWHEKLKFAPVEVSVPGTGEVVADAVSQ